MRLDRKKTSLQYNNHELSSIILYTIAENDKKARLDLEKLLKSKHFEKEGDQSTMIRSGKYKSIRPYELKSLIDELCKITQFTEGDFITLINPAHQVIKLNNNNYFYKNILRHYRYDFDKNSNSFSIMPNRRDSILKIEVKK